MQLKKIVAVLGFVVISNSAMAATFGVGAYELPASASSAFGDDAVASGSQATATGTSTRAGTTDGLGNPYLLLTPTYAYYSQTASGFMAEAWGSGDSAFGSNAIAVSQPALGAVTSATSIGWRATTWGNDSIAIGSNAAVGTAAPGTSPTTPITMTGGTAIGANSRVLGNNSTAIGAGAQVVGAVNSVALGAGSVATADNTVSVGSAGATRRIENVTDGVANQDAATWGQVQRLVTTSGGTDITARNMATAADNKATAALNRIGELESGVAASMAMGAANSNAVQAAYRSTKGMGLGIGASVFAGRSVTAVSYAANLSFGSVSASASLSGSPAVQVGAGFAF